MRLKKILLINSMLFLTIGYAMAQATDFIADDCNGNSHHLFNELDMGNIIVIAWVMPCNPCATYSLPAYLAVESFITTHPGQVHFYMADDYANTQCSSLSSWGINYNMPNSTFFSSPDINMNGYGTHGMPKVVVLGGSSHTIYFNENDVNINQNDVESAINNALSTSTNINDKANNSLQITSFTNPTNNLLNISYKSSKNKEIKFEVINILGKRVLIIKENLLGTFQEYKSSIDVSNLYKGTYLLNISTDSHKETLKFIVAN